jgi:hypothetical protein
MELLTSAIKSLNRDFNSTNEILTLNRLNGLLEETQVIQRQLSFLIVLRSLGELK